MVLTKEDIIIKFRKGNDEKDLSINGKCPYFRILIKNKRLKSTLLNDHIISIKNHGLLNFSLETNIQQNIGIQ